MALIRVLAVLGLILAGVAANAADLPEPFVVKGEIDEENPCADNDVLQGIADRFAWAERNTWHRGFVMATLANGRLGDHPYFEPGIIRREYCRADSVMTNGDRHAVYYAIEFGQGFASIGKYVDFCVLGLDPWRVHDDQCRTVR